MNALARNLSSTAVTTSANSPQDPWRKLGDVTAKLLREIFSGRCEVRAILCEAAKLTLHEAVDVLQRDAECDGLVDMLGQDAVQAMIAEAFGPVASATNAAPQNKNLTNSNADKMWTAANAASRLPASTIAAADYLVRLKDGGRLRAWLARHSRAERIGIIKHIRRHQS